MNAPVGVTIFCSLLLSQWPSVGAAAGSGCNLECVDGEAHWGYDDDDGPECWGSCYGECSAGTQQSPINIVTSQVTTETSCDPLRLTGWSKKHTMSMINNGHSAKLKLKAGTYKTAGIGLQGQHVADSLHFHWGETDEQGSEHQINGAAAPLEMHIVHYSSQYNSLAEALGNEGGVAVLGFLFHVAPEENEHFSDIVDNLEHIHFKDDQIDLDDQKLRDLLPTWNSGIYFRYRGSLTTPTCTQGLVWTVFSDTIAISREQLQAFRSTLDAEEAGSAHNHIVSHNFRSDQPLNGRAVTKGFVRCDSNSLASS